MDHARPQSDRGLQSRPHSSAAVGSAVLLFFRCHVIKKLTLHVVPSQRCNFKFKPELLV